MSGLSEEGQAALDFIRARRQSSKALSDDLGMTDEQLAQEAAIKASELGFNDETRSNKAFVLSKVAQSVGAFEYADETLKADKDFVKEVVKHHPHGFFFASSNLKSDKEFIADLIEIHPEVIRFASAELRADAELAAMAVSKDCSVLKYVSSELFISSAFLSGISEALLDSGNQAKFASDRDFQTVTEKWKFVQELDDFNKLFELFKLSKLSK